MEPTIYTMYPGRGHSNIASPPLFCDSTRKTKSSQSARKASSSKGLWCTLGQFSVTKSLFLLVNQWGRRDQNSPCHLLFTPSLYKSVIPSELEDETCMSTTSELQRPLSLPAQHPLPSRKHRLCTHTCVFPVTTFLTANAHVPGAARTPTEGISTSQRQHGVKNPRQ